MQNNNNDDNVKVGSMEAVYLVVLLYSPSFANLSLSSECVTVAVSLL